MASSGSDWPLSAMTWCIMCRSRIRRAWSCIQPAWKAASWRLSAKTDQLLVSIGGGVYHRLGQNVDIGHRDGPNLAGRFDDTPTDLE